MLSRQPKDDRAIAEIVSEASGLDDRHDDLARAIDAYFSYLYSVTPDEAARKSIDRLRLLLLPEGLLIVNRNYREEAGAAAQLDARLGADDRAQMAKWMIHDGGTLLSLVEEWVAAGRRLGLLEDKRVAAEQASEGATPRELQHSRNQWMHCVSLLLGNLALGETAEATRDAILGPLREVVAGAGEREARRGRAAGTDSPLPDATRPVSTDHLAPLESTGNGAHP